MITNAFRMRRSEYVLGRPRGRLAGAGGQGRWSMSSTRLTRRLIWRSISVPPQCGCVVTEILRGQLCCDDAWHGCFIYDHVSINRELNRGINFSGDIGRGLASDNLVDEARRLETQAVMVGTERREGPLLDPKGSVDMHTRDTLLLGGFQNEAGNI